MSRDLKSIPVALDDLESYVRAVYRHNGQECHPALRARFDRDMSVVTKARTANDELVKSLEDAIAMGLTLPDESHHPTEDPTHRATPQDALEDLLEIDAPLDPRD